MKYIVKAKKVTPNSAASILRRSFRCYLGISVGQPNFSGERLRALLQWTATHTSEVLVVVGDRLQRYNLMATKGCPESEAIATADELGDDFLREFAPAAADFGLSNFKIIRWRDLLVNPAYPSFRDKINDAFCSELYLWELLLKSADDYLTRKSRFGVQFFSKYDDVRRLAVNYLLEEIAVFALLARDGNTVDVYPGQELPVLKALTKGFYPAIPECLRQRINIELTMREVERCYATSSKKAPINEY